jgi:hypothetical protein
METLPTFQRRERVRQGRILALCRLRCEFRARADAQGSSIEKRDATNMTRCPHRHSDKLSRLVPPSELSEQYSPCGIRSLAESG